ncbi:Uncharacterised protein [uncultured archaeon]|nr:Uncharacterised protein [uncultured archaeon]
MAHIRQELGFGFGCCLCRIFSRQQHLLSMLALRDVFHGAIKMHAVFISNYSGVHGNPKPGPISSLHLQFASFQESLLRNKRYYTFSIFWIGIKLLADV